MEGYEYFIIELAYLMKTNNVDPEQQEEIFNMLEKIINTKGEM